MVASVESCGITDTTMHFFPEVLFMTYFSYPSEQLSHFSLGFFFPFFCKNKTAKFILCQQDQQTSHT
jgi:hypothetical protein